MENDGTELMAFRLPKDLAQTIRARAVGAVTITDVVVRMLRAAPEGEQAMSDEQKKYVVDEAALASRRRGQQPNYIQTHFCDQCQVEYQCPDRYTEKECGPTKEAARLGWAPSNKYRCFACGLDDPNRSAWWEAHKL